MHITSKISSVHDGNKTKEHIRFSIHFAFHLKKNGAEAIAMICAAYGENAVSLHVKDGIKNLTKEISVLKLNRVLDALKRLKRTNCKHCWI
ncbi:hypothetical protein P5V15_001119 [Pogonomyrmex californicus]